MVSKRHYTPSTKQQALNELYQAISVYTKTILIDKDQQIQDLIKLCLQNGATQNEIAKVMKISRQSVFNLIKGQNLLNFREPDQDKS